MVLPVQPTVQEVDSSVQTKQDREQIDRITYLSSLVSKFEDVDPMMDVLRSITASWDGSTPLDAVDSRKLQALEQSLKDYLVHKDPLRAFTAESLEQQLSSKKSARRTNTATRSLFVILAASFAAAALAYLPILPLPANERPLLAIPLFFVALHIGISWLYLTALKNFNQDTRKAFVLVVVGVVLFAVAFSHYAAIQAFHLQRYPIFQFAGLTWLVTVPFFCIYLGMRTYAKQLGVQSWALKMPIVVVVLIALVIPMGLIPPVAHQERYVAVFQNTGGIGMPYFALLGVLLVRKIRKVVTPVYARPMMWMYIYLIVNFITSSLANIPYSPDPNGGFPLYAMMLIFGVPDQLLLLMTGYSFKKELSK